MFPSLDNYETIPVPNIIRMCSREPLMVLCPDEARSGFPTLRIISGASPDTRESASSPACKDGSWLQEKAQG